jgi:hypothetical protein
LGSDFSNFPTQTRFLTDLLNYSKKYFRIYILKAKFTFTFSEFCTLPNKQAKKEGVSFFLERNQNPYIGESLKFRNHP